MSHSNSGVKVSLRVELLSFYPPFFSQDFKGSLSENIVIPLVY